MCTENCSKPKLPDCRCSSLAEPSLSTYRVATLMQKQNSLTFPWPNSVFHWPKYCGFTTYLSSLLRITAKAYQLVKDLTTEKQGKFTNIQDKSGKCLTEENEILNRWTEYCSDLYNYETDGDQTVFDCPQIPDEEHHPILREEVEAAVKALKMGKSAGVDNIPAEWVQAGGEAMIDILTAIYNKIWKTGEWPTTWTQSLVITLPKKGNLQVCQNYKTISLISHPKTQDHPRQTPQSAVLFNGSTGEWFRTTVGVRQGCLLSSTLFNIFLERIMCEALDDHEGSVSIRGRLITNFRFADDIVVNAEEEEEAGVLLDRLDRTTTR